MCIRSILNTMYLYVPLKNILNTILIAVLYIKFPDFPCPFPPQLVQLLQVLFFSVLSGVFSVLQVYQVT